MSTIDWIEVWFLNELVWSSVSLYRLIHKYSDQWTSRWSFPGNAILSSSLEDRVLALIDCITKNFIHVYSKNILSEISFDKTQPLSISQIDFMDKRFLEESIAVISFAGHEQWESIFAPNWNRYWDQIYGTEIKEAEDSCTISIVFAGDEIYADLREWLPVYIGLGLEARMSVLECTAAFHYPASAWKIIECAKIAKFKAINVSKNYKMTIDEFATLTKYKSQRDIAINALSRLSKKWISVSTSETDPRNGVPLQRNDSK